MCNDIFIYYKSQLFAYAMGAKNDQREVMLKTYPQCYEVVKAYLEEYLGIGIQEKHNTLDVEMQLISNNFINFFAFRKYFFSIF